MEPDEGAPEVWNDMLLRAVFVVDDAQRIEHVEFVMEQMDEPNYTKVEQAVARLKAA